MRTENIPLRSGLDMQAFSPDDFNPEGIEELEDQATPRLSDQELMDNYHGEELVLTQDGAIPVIERFSGNLDQFLGFGTAEQYVVPVSFREFAYNLIEDKLGRGDIIDREEFLIRGMFPVEAGSPISGKPFNGSTFHIEGVDIENGVINFRYGPSTYFPFFALCSHMDANVQEYDGNSKIAGTIRDSQTLSDGTWKPFNRRATPSMVGTGTALLAPMGSRLYFVGGQRINTHLFPGTNDIIGKVPTFEEFDPSRNFSDNLYDSVKAVCEGELGFAQAGLSLDGFQAINARLVDEPPRGAPSILVTAVTTTQVSDIAEIYSQSATAQGHLGVLYAIQAERAALSDLGPAGFKVSPGAKAARYFALTDIGR